MLTYLNWKPPVLFKNDNFRKFPTRFEEKISNNSAAFSPIPTVFILDYFTHQIIRSLKLNNIPDILKEGHPG